MGNGRRIIRDPGNILIEERGKAGRLPIPHFPFPNMIKEVRP